MLGLERSGQFKDIAFYNQYNTNILKLQMAYAGLRDSGFLGPSRFMVEMTFEPWTSLLTSSNTDFCIFFLLSHFHFNLTDLMDQNIFTLLVLYLFPSQATGQPQDWKCEYKLEA